MSYGMKRFGKNKKLGEYVTVAEINSQGIIISRSSGEKGIIPLEHLEEYDADTSDFRVGERFDVFPLAHKRKGGKREKRMVDGLTVYSLSYKSNSGIVYKSIKIDRIKLGITTPFEQFDDEQKRIYLFDLLEDLFRDDLDALIQLDHYCRNRNNKVDDRVRRILIARYVLNEDGTLPDSTNEVMYELRTGYRPFWLKDKDECKIIYLEEYIQRKKNKQND